MCMAACLLVFSLGSLLVKRDSGSFDPTTGWLSQIKDPQLNWFNYSYDASGRERAVDYGVGIDSSYL